MIAIVKIQRRGDMIEATIESHLATDGNKIPLDSDPVLQVFENQNSYVFVSMFVLDEQQALDYLARQSPMDITLKSPSFTEVVRI